MAQVKLIVGGRTYDLACRDGEEPRLEMLAQMLDSKARDAGQLVGSANETRQLLLAGLLLADELSDLRSGAPDPGKAALARTLDQLAERVESLAERLEQGAPTP
ncbi:MAG TPA: cell division protein ZapA [Sphingomonas sp.]|uniref:cell division protein ZapA n=1 Tax=Sphingomonas sp. TaxID=28214 RepID=UPI002CDD945F|nr:cell division protein ZapA [Sphingomonas sp.]HMI19995.1 cell division protein ZapA [Sphingomonas sp.]